MADESPFPFSALDGALQQAHAEIDAMRASASDADEVASRQHLLHALHEVDGIGRYVITQDNGWEPLLFAIRDAQTAIQFSAVNYPSFDKRIAETLAEKASIAALPAPLRENLAAVRNFLMQTYYSETPAGMTAEQAALALQEIAILLGDGLYGPVTPYQEAKKPFIDMHLASQPNGAGAQYIYEKILEMHRQSDWVRPFSAIVAMFGGKLYDWMLPGAEDTPFYTLYDTPRSIDAMTSEVDIDEALKRLDAFEEQRRVLEETIGITATAADLAAMGDQLLHTADTLNDVRAMSEPVRQDAIEIAKDILRKLKVSIGAINLMDGLNLKPRDDLGSLGGIRAVTLVYERLLAWGRGIDPTIMQHPSILAATQAIGQIGAIAKMEALRIARKAGETAQVHALAQQAMNIPAAYAKPNDKQMAGLLDKVERGIDTVLNRVVTINGPGASVGHSRSNEIGNYMSGTPIAGMALQGSAEGVGGASTARQQAAVQEGQVAVQRAQMQRAQQAANQQSRSSSNTAQPTIAARGTASAQLAALRQRLAARRTATTQQNLQGVRINANRNAMLANLHHHDEHDHHGHPPDAMAATVAKIDPRILNNLKQMNSTTAGLTTNPVMTGRAAYDKMKQANTYGLKGGTATPKAMTDEERKKQQLQNPPPPPKKDTGRGF